METSRPSRSIEEMEAELEQMTRELTDLERAVTARRMQLIRSHKLLELLKKVREFRRSPNVQEIEELAKDVGL